MTTRTHIACSLRASRLRPLDFESRVWFTCSMTTTAARIGTCSRCGTTRTITGESRYLSCDVCAVNADLLAERDAFITEHPEGYFPMGILKMVKVRGKLGKRECDEACTSATGPACTCKCGGRNHGSTWLS